MLLPIQQNHPASVGRARTLRCPGGGGNAARWLGINAPSVGNVQYRVFSYASSGTLSMPGLIATGRWF